MLVGRGSIHCGGVECGHYRRGRLGGGSAIGLELHLIGHAHIMNRELNDRQSGWGRFYGNDGLYLLYWGNKATMSVL